MFWKHNKRLRILIWFEQQHDIWKSSERNFEWKTTTSSVLRIQDGWVEHYDI